MAPSVLLIFQRPRCRSKEAAGSWLPLGGTCKDEAVKSPSINRVGIQMGTYLSDVEDLWAVWDSG